MITNQSNHPRLHYVFTSVYQSITMIKMITSITKSNH